MSKKQMIRKDLGPDFKFRKITNNDLALMQKWLSEPHVSKWWPILKPGESIEQFLHRIRSKNNFGYIVLMNEIPMGYIQYYYIDRLNKKSGSWLPADLPATTVGTDQFIGNPDYIGKGYGTLFIKEFIKFIQTVEPDMTTIILDPDPENTAAIRAYEKVGFKKVAIFSVDGGSHLLMRYDITANT